MMDSHQFIIKISMVFSVFFAFGFQQEVPRQCCHLPAIMEKVIDNNLGWNKRNGSTNPINGFCGNAFASSSCPLSIFHVQSFFERSIAAYLGFISAK
jgi:hypothetical protein